MIDLLDALYLVVLACLACVPLACVVICLRWPPRD
jgi:hypothetical protein